MTSKISASMSTKGNTCDQKNDVSGAPGHIVDRALGALSEIMSSIGSVWYFALVGLICTEVVAREAFDAPILGITVITAYSVVGAAFLQLSNTLHSERMMRADFFLRWLQGSQPVAHKWFEVIVSIIGFIAMALIVKAGWSKLGVAYSEAELVGAPGLFSFQVWPFRFLVVLGAFTTALVFLARAAFTFRELLSTTNKRFVAISTVAVTVIGACLLFAATQAIATGPSDTSVGITMLVLLLLAIVSGLHIGVALILAGFIGLWVIKGKIGFAFAMVAIASNEYLANYFLSAIPLFILMGLLVSVSDIGRETFSVARWLTQRILGGLGIATVGANAVFAAITGSSIASATVFAKIAAPEMISHGYTRQFSVGVVAGSSVLGMLIPPSVLLIVYSLLAEQSVGLMFIAAIVPGLILASTMCAVIVLMAKFMPSRVFADGAEHSAEAQENLDIFDAAVMLLPIMSLILLVLGGIYGGLFTPTEGGAVGALGALLFAVVRRKLDLRKLWSVMVETGQITTTVLFLILAASVFTRMLAGSGLIQQISTWIIALDLGFTEFALIYVALLIVLGMFLESVSIMLIVVPLALPAVIAVGGDPVWFGILTVVAVEVGLLTPPFGLTCYVVNATLRERDIPLSEIFHGAFPFVMAMLLVVLLIIAMPWLAALQF